MTRRVRAKRWGLREWSIVLTMTVAAASLLTTMISWYQKGGNTVTGWVDGRASLISRKVVGDSLDEHRQRYHSGRQPRRGSGR